MKSFSRSKRSMTPGADILQTELDVCCLFVSVGLVETKQDGDCVHVCVHVCALEQPHYSLVSDPEV